MIRPTPILVSQSGIDDPRYPVPIKPDTEAWYDWFENHKSFRYQENFTDGIFISKRFTANKDTRGYWTASRKMDGKLKRKRLGKSRDLTYDKLVEVAIALIARRKYDDPAKMYQEIRKQYEKLKSDTWGLKAERDHYKRRCEELELVIRDLERDDMR